MKKINILYIPSDVEGGVFYYRTLTPMTKLKEMFQEDYEVFITNDLNIAWKLIKDMNILIVHNCLCNDSFQFKLWNVVVEAKKIGIKTIVDMDDYWNYGSEHPMIGFCNVNKFPVKAPVNFNVFDYVTTTTNVLKGEIMPYNKNVEILENSISLKDNQYSTDKNKSDKIRIGLAGGSSHTNDVKQIVSENDSIFDYLSNDVKNKIQFVLCGFNINGKNIVLDEHGEVVSQGELSTDNIWWVELEKIITKNYTIVSDEYKELLLKYDKSDEAYDASNEPYRRVWTKSIKDGEYGLIYKNIDILLVPLTNTKFNGCKSELKQIEAGFTNTAVITSGVQPYIDYGTDYKDCLFVNKPSCKEWAYKIEELVNDDKLRERITKNLHEKVLKDRQLEDITKKRDAFYKKILNINN